MDLDKIRVAVRPRNASEATDLGFVIARHWWRPLLLSWLMVAMPLSVLFHFVCYQAPWLTGILIWWFKPLYEQAPLYILSRALFAEKTSMKEVLKNFRSITGKQWFANLTWRRLTPRRSFNAPVSLLEGLKGKDRRARIAVLHGSRPSGGWLTFICIHLELVIYLSLFFLLALFIPEEMDVDLSGLIGGDMFWMMVVQNIFYLVAIAIIAPFYVAAGFSLYLHRRIELEAWDIELGFRQLAQRLDADSRNVKSSNIKSGTARSVTGSLVSLLLCCLLWGGAGVEVSAAVAPAVEQPRTELNIQSEQSDRDHTRRQISGILSDPLFGQEEIRNKWRYIGEEEKRERADSLNLEWLKRLVQIIAAIGEGVLWFIAALLIAWIIYLYPKWSVWFGLINRKSHRHYRPPETLFGLDVRPESLPEDIPATVWQLYQDGQPRAALSLLYRATLVHLINYHHMEFHKGTTEGECVVIVAQSRHRSSRYFLQLTRTWKTMAYNHQPPALEEMRCLCDQWCDQLQVKSVSEPVQ